MSRSVRRKLEEQGNDKVSSFVDWTTLPYDIVLQLFACLNYGDRARLASTCKAWRSLGASSFLWSSLDLRGYKFDASMASSLASRCVNLRKLRFCGVESADSIIHLKAKNLLELSGDSCNDITNDTLSKIVARHEALESLQLVRGYCEMITTDGIKNVAFSCPNLKKLRISGIKDVTSEALEALASRCPHLIDIGFLNCLKIDEEALARVVSVRYLSVAGSSNINWSIASNKWDELPELICLDLSTTDIGPTAVSKLLKSSQSLKVICALDCHVLEEDASFIKNNKFKGKYLLASFNNVFDSVTSIITKDKDIMSWIEWSVSNALSLLSMSDREDFWLNQGVALLLTLLKSSQEDVQETSAIRLSNFGNVYDERGEVVLKYGGIGLLLELSKSCQEGLQSGAAMAIASFSGNDNVAKELVEGGGIRILVGMVKSMNKNMVIEAASGLWDIAIGDENKNAIVEIGGVKALVDLLFRWENRSDDVLKPAVGVLANLSSDEKCSTEVTKGGGVHALVMLVRNCKHEGVQELAASALLGLASHRGTSSETEATIGQEPGALEALIKLTQSPHESVRQEAAGALWNLSSDDKNQEAIAAANGVEALVALAQSNPSTYLGTEVIQERAAGALSNLAFNPGIAYRILKEDGVPTLVRLCSSSASKMARFVAALALAYMFDGRMDEYVLMIGTSTPEESTNLNGARKMALENIKAFVLTYTDPQIFTAAAVSSTMLAQFTERACIQEVGIVRCSSDDIGKFITMLRNPSSILKSFAAFALLQFTIPGGYNAMLHASFMRDKGDARRVLRSVSAGVNMPREAKIFAKIILRNLENHWT